LTLNGKTIRNKTAPGTEHKAEELHRERVPQNASPEQEQERTQVLRAWIRQKQTHKEQKQLERPKLYNRRRNGQEPQCHRRTIARRASLQVEQLPPPWLQTAKMTQTEEI